MLETKDWVALIVSLVGVCSSTVIAYFVYALNRQTHRSQMDRAIAESYNLLMNFRSEHPEVLKLSRLWTASHFRIVYTQAVDQDKQWAHYYTYVELCMGFVSNVLYASRSRLLDRQAYEGHYKPLIRLLLTEHDPFVRSVLPAGKYISTYVKDFRQELEREGWDWSAMHRALVE